VNFKSWLQKKEGEEAYLPKTHREVDIYDSSPEFQKMIPIRLTTNSLMNHLDALDKFVTALKTQSINLTPGVKARLKRLRDIVVEVLAMLKESVTTYCMTFFTGRYLESSVVGFWATGRKRKAIKTIDRALDLLDAPHRSHLCLLYLAQYPVLLAEAQEWKLLGRYIRVVGWFQSGVPLAVTLHDAAVSLYSQNGQTYEIPNV